MSYVCRRLGPNLLHGENGVTASLEMAWSTGIVMNVYLLCGNKNPPKR